MPRLGMRMIPPAEYEMMTWLGRGPQETMQTARQEHYRPLQRHGLGNSSIRMCVPRDGQSL